MRPGLDGDVTTLSQAVSEFLQGSHLPPGLKLTWVGVDLAITNTGQQWIAPGGAGGTGAAVFYFVVNGHGPFRNDTPTSTLTQLALQVGVASCPFPLASLLNPGTTTSGCVALAVPVGVKVSTVGFDLQPVQGGPVQHVAQWNV